MLDAHLVVDRAAFRLDIQLAIGPGEVVALLGPNGAGKTTALRALAGLQPLHGGHITLAGTDLDRPDRRVWTPPERRRVGVVFQDYLLFPHLTALDNVAFGPRRHGSSRAEARARAGRWLDRVGLADVARRKPRNLSGGQAQRVALARALAVLPSLLLLDEPLAALDARTRVDTRAELSRHLAEHPGAALLVTHDPLDALVLADRLVIVEDGRVVQEGDATSITAQPRTDYVAQLVGLNLYRGESAGHVVTLPAGGAALGVGALGVGALGVRSLGVGALGGGGLGVAAGFEADEFVLTAADDVHGAAFVAFPPSAVSLFVGRPDGSPRNAWPATVVGIQRYGDSLRVQLSGPIAAAADVTPAAAAQLRLVPGAQVWAAVKAAATHAYPV